MKSVPNTNPFYCYAPRYREMGISVVPCRGKKPATQWKDFQRSLVSERKMATWLDQHKEHNIGLITGEISKLCVVDCDDPEISINELFQMFGETSVVVETPSGGKHLYYRYNGERNRVGIGGKRIDIRGEGGLVIAPPSVNAEKGKSYRFIIGNELDLKSLPCMISNFSSQHISQEPSTATGHRNKALFSKAVNIAPCVSDFSDFLEQLHQINECDNVPPLPKQEVEKVARSAWQYKENGNLFVAGKQYVTFVRSLFIKLWLRSSDASSLYMLLLAAHPNSKSRSFAISPKALEKSLGVSRQRIRNAINTLMEELLIHRTHTGGKKPGDTHLYQWVWK